MNVGNNPEKSRLFSWPTNVEVKNPSTDKQMNNEENVAYPYFKDSFACE